jgi:hypothetical protein
LFKMRTFVKTDLDVVTERLCYRLLSISISHNDIKLFSLSFAPLTKYVVVRGLIYKNLLKIISWAFCRHLFLIFSETMLLIILPKSVM